MRSIRNSMPTEKEQAAHQMSVILNIPRIKYYRFTCSWNVRGNFSLSQSQPVQTGDSTDPHRNLESINLTIFPLSSSSLQRISKVHPSLGHKALFSPLCLC